MTLNLTTCTLSKLARFCQHVPDADLPAYHEWPLPDPLAISGRCLAYPHPNTLEAQTFGQAQAAYDLIKSDAPPFVLLRELVAIYLYPVYYRQPYHYQLTDTAELEEAINAAPARDVLPLASEYVEELEKMSLFWSDKFPPVDEEAESKRKLVRLLNPKSAAFDTYRSIDTVAQHRRITYEQAAQLRHDVFMRTVCSLCWDIKEAKDLQKLTRPKRPTE